jgi:hypothetical protein
MVITIIIIIIIILTLLLHIYDITSYYCIFLVEYLPDDGRKRPKHVEGLPHVCILPYLIIVQLLEYMLSPSCPSLPIA